MVAVDASCGCTPRSSDVGVHEREEAVHLLNTFRTRAPEESQSPMFPQQHSPVVALLIAGHHARAEVLSDTTEHRVID